MPFLLRVIFISVTFFGFSWPVFSQESIYKQLKEIEKKGGNEAISSYIAKYYQNILRGRTQYSQELDITNNIIKIAIQAEDNNNNMMAFYIMKNAYEIIYPSLQESNARIKLIYFYAYFLMVINENKEAIELLTVKSIDIQKELHNDLETIVLISKLFIGEGEYIEALLWCQRGLALIDFNKKNNYFLSLMTNKINCYVKLKKHNKVLYYSKEIKSAIKNNTYHQVHYHINLGDSYVNERKFDEARSSFKKNASFNKGKIESLLFDEYHIARTYQEEQLYDKSIKLFDVIITKLKHYYPTLQTSDVANVYKSQSKNYYLIKDFAKGDLYTLIAFKMLNYDGSLRTFKGSKVSLLDIIVNKVIFNTSVKDLSSLYFADSLIDLMRQEHTEQSSKLFWREKTHTFYENAIETCYLLKDYEKAFYFMEKSRAILLLDGLKDLDAKKILSTEKQNQEQNLRYKIIGLQNELENTTETDKNYTKIYPQLINTKEAYHSFIQSLEKSNLSYFQLKYGNQYISLSSLQATLMLSNQSFIEYFVGEKTVYAFVATAKDARMLKINLQEYNLLSKQFLSMTAQKPPHTAPQLNDFCLVANKLYKLIYAPLKIPIGRVIISQDNYFLPFGSLVTDPQRQKFLVEDYAFSYSYSANILFREKAKSISFNKNLLGFSPIHYNKSLNLNTLSGSDQVLNNIEDKYFSGKVFLEKQATKQNFIQNAPNYKIIQLFTHGKAEIVSDKSRIYFYDSALNMKELYQLEKLKAELVVLSACETNLGINATGEGIMSFARGFAFLGVPATVSTLWSVNNQSTYQLTEGFYKYLNDGYQKDVALQMAQKDYLKNSGYVFPYYWSGVVLVGDTMSISESNFSYLPYLFFVLVFLGILYYLKRNSTLY